MNQTKIEWCDMTFNPVTGCLHGCEYCYARRVANRFGCGAGDGGEHFLGEPMMKPKKLGSGDAIDPYPYGFDPTFHRYRLREPARKTKGRTIFVCSMADLFGKWVPDDWIAEVFGACRKAPQHRYLFLTKNPGRYMELAKAGKLPEEKNFWYGSTATTPDTEFWWSDNHNTFVSIEPMLAPFQSEGDAAIKKVDWLITGAMTGPGSKDHQPKREWVESLVKDAQATEVPVFMKDSLIPIVGEEGMMRELPWGEP